MILSRETIITALYDRLSGITFPQPVQGKTTWVTKSRKLIHWSEVPAEQRPAFFLTEHEESTSYQAVNLPKKLTISLQIFIYWNSKNPVPATDVNVLLDAIDAALEPGPADKGRQTLGGIVQHCRIEGQTLKVPGDIDGEALLIIPIKIFVT